MCYIWKKRRFWKCILKSTRGLCGETILMIVLNLQMDNFTLILFSQNAAHAQNLNMVSKEIEYFCSVPDIGTIFLLLSPGRRGWWQEGDNIKWLRLRENKTRILGSSLFLKNAVSRHAACIFFIVLLNKYTHKLEPYSYTHSTGIFTHWASVGEENVFVTDAFLCIWLMLPTSHWSRLPSPGLWLAGNVSEPETYGTLGWARQWESWL